MTRLEELLLARSVRRGSFVLASGERSSYYIDCRLTTMSAEGLALVGREGLAAIRAAGWEATAIGGLTLGADPVAYAIAVASFTAGPVIDAFTVRKEPKQHGTRRLIEGNLAAGARAVVVQDPKPAYGGVERGAGMDQHQGLPACPRAGRDGNTGVYPADHGERGELGDWPSA